MRRHRFQNRERFFGLLGVIALVTAILLGCSVGGMVDVGTPKKPRSMTPAAQGVSAAAVSGTLPLSASISFQAGAISADRTRYLSSVLMRRITVGGVPLPEGARIDVYSDETQVGSCLTTSCDCIFGLELPINPLGGYRVEMRLHNRADVGQLRLDWNWLPDHY